jgi:hypothetical protein
MVNYYLQSLGDVQLLFKMTGTFNHAFTPFSVKLKTSSFYVPTLIKHLRGVIKSWRNNLTLFSPEISKLD